MDSLLVFTFGLSISAISAPFAIMLCKAVGLMDKPSKRKQHHGQIPLAGGMMLLVTVAVFGFLVESISPVLFAILFAAPLLFLIGAVDDRFDMPAKFKLLLQGIVGVALVSWLGIRVVSLDNVLTGDPLVLSIGISMVFSIACFCGVLNAANMADGIDGLLGSLSIISLTSVAFLYFASGYHDNLDLVMVLLGALVAYLSFNIGVFGRQFKIFLGDSGSLIIGLALFALLVSGASPDGAAFTPTSAGWLLGIPLMDTISVMLRRIMHRRSPFEAGRDHLHHLMLELRFSRYGVLGALSIFHLSLVFVGVVANYSSVSQVVFFWGFVIMTALVTLVSFVIERFISSIERPDMFVADHEIEDMEVADSWIGNSQNAEALPVEIAGMSSEKNEAQKAESKERRPVRAVS